MSRTSSEHHRSAGAPTGARRILRRSLIYLTVLVPLLAACETGPEVVSNSVAGCIAHIKLAPQYGEPYCRCLGDEMEHTFTYAQIRQYRLKTDNWTYFVDVMDDTKLMHINQVCLARHVPEQFR